MKTSLDIDDRLYELARLRAVRERTTIRALVEAGLKRVLGVEGDEPGRTEAEIALERADLESLAAQVSALPLLDRRSADEILDYDEAGLFR